MENLWVSYPCHWFAGCHQLWYYPKCYLIYKWIFTKTILHINVPTPLLSNPATQMTLLLLIYYSYSCNYEHNSSSRSSWSWSHHDCSANNDNIKTHVVTVATLYDTRNHCDTSASIDQVSLSSKKLETDIKVYQPVDITKLCPIPMDLTLVRHPKS